MKTTFGALWVGDRFTAHGSLWTRLDHRTARQHRPESIELGERGAGFLADTICSFEPDEQVEFVPPRPAALASVLTDEQITAGVRALLVAEQDEGCSSEAALAAFRAATDGVKGLDDAQG